MAINIILISALIPCLLIPAVMLVKTWQLRSRMKAKMPEKGRGKEKKNPDTALEVGKFYDAQTANFMKVYGEVIQAFRTNDLDKLLAYQLDAMQLKEGMRALDAGCGVCGPAIWFARESGVKIDAVTISEVQAGMARKRVSEVGLQENICVHHGDYHHLHEIVEENAFDVVYYLESFGHSHDKEALFDSAWKILKPGGLLYIKDLFVKEAIHPGQKAIIDREVQRINDAYHYHIADLYETLAYLRKNGWIIAHLKTVDLPLEDFENLSISNDFQELTGIGRIDSWSDYVFPVEFYELKCYKPWMDLETGTSRYFLQNMYYQQVLKLSEAEIKDKRMHD